MVPMPSKHSDFYWIEGSALDAPSEYALFPDQEKGIIEYVRGLISYGNGHKNQPPDWRVTNTSPFPVHISFRYGGVLAGEGIAVGDSLQANLQKAVKRAFRLGARATGKFGDPVSDNVLM